MVSENRSGMRWTTPTPDGHVILETVATRAGETELAQHGGGRPEIRRSESNGPGQRMPGKHHAHHAGGDALPSERRRYFIPDLHFATRVRGTGKSTAADDHGLVSIDEKIERPLRITPGEKNLWMLGPATRQRQAQSFDEIRGPRSKSRLCRSVISTSCIVFSNPNTQSPDAACVPSQRGYKKVHSGATLLSVTMP